MGNLFTNVFSKLFSSNKTYNILILGLANAGKTTLLYQMSLNKAVQTTPTIGSNVQQITHKNIKLSAWDLGGQQRIRSIWSSYYTRTNGVIFVVDSTDMKNEVIAKTQLFKIVIHEVFIFLHIKAFEEYTDSYICEQARSKRSNELIIDNKIIQFALDQVAFMVLENVLSFGRYAVCQTKGNGIKEGLDWLTDQLLNNSGSK